MHLSAGSGCRHSAAPANRGAGGGSRMSLRFYAPALLLAFLVFAAISVDSYAMPRPKHVLAVVPRSKHVLALVPRPRPTESHPKHILALVPRSRPTDLCAPAPVTTPFAMPPDALALAAMNAMSADVPAVKQAIELVRTCRAPLRRQTKGGRAAARRAPCVPTHPRGMPPRMRRSGAHMRRAGTRRSPGCWALHLDTIEAGEPVERERHHCRLSLLSETSP